MEPSYPPPLSANPQSLHSSVNPIPTGNREILLRSDRFNEQPFKCAPWLTHIVIIAADETTHPVCRKILQIALVFFAAMFTAATCGVGYLFVEPFVEFYYEARNFLKSEPSPSQFASSPPGKDSLHKELTPSHNSAFKNPKNTPPLGFTPSKQLIPALVLDWRPKSVQFETP